MAEWLEPPHNDRFYKALKKLILQHPTGEIFLVDKWKTWATLVSILHEVPFQIYCLIQTIYFDRHVLQGAAVSLVSYFSNGILCLS